MLSDLFFPARASRLTEYNNMCIISSTQERSIHMKSMYKPYIIG